jgi:hypothetical protein
MLTRHNDDVFLEQGLFEAEMPESSSLSHDTSRRSTLHRTFACVKV